MEVEIGTFHIGDGNLPVIIAGPCVVESEDIAFHTAGRLKALCSSAGLPFIFKSSYDKANRTSVSSYRGPGIEKGLAILAEVKRKFGVPVLSDVHSVDEIKTASAVLDVLQLPAFLCRQTDLIIAASETGKPVNIKKGQFLAPWDVRHIVQQVCIDWEQKAVAHRTGYLFRL